MLCNRLSPPKTLPKRRNVKETGRKRMETISISPTAKNNGIRPMKTYIPTSFLSALLPKMWIAIFLIPSNFKDEIQPT
jgi:hypothetical protein